MADYHYRLTFLDELNRMHKQIMTLPIHMSIERVIYQFEEDYYRAYGHEIMVTNIEKLDEE